MKDSWFRIEFIDERQKDYFDNVHRSTYIYPLEPYRGLNQFSETAYISTAIRKYRCSFEEAFDRFYRILQNRNYEELTQIGNWGYEDTMNMLEYEAKNRIKLPTRRV